jgi:hypothetical protein
MPPVIASSRTSATSFEDKEQIWADNAESSPFFGNVYVCVDDFRSNSRGRASSQTVSVDVSTDGGNTWTVKQISTAETNATRGFHQGCTVRTDSEGNVYVFYTHFAIGLPGFGAHTMQKSTDGGRTWSRPRDILPANDACFDFDPVYGRCVADGYAGARIDLLSAPSVDIANGAPTGEDATDEIVDVWNDGSLGLNNEKTLFSYSMNGGDDWTDPAIISLAGDRPIYAAPAIAPDGSRVYAMYEALTDPWRGDDFDASRGYRGVFLSAELGDDGAPGAWSTLFEGSNGDIRGTYPGHDIYQERVGDYVYAAASRDYGVGVWSSAYDAAVCPAVQEWRAESFAAGERVLPGAPWPLADCPDTFGNVQILAVSNG